MEKKIIDERTGWEYELIGEQYYPTGRVMRNGVLTPEEKPEENEPEEEYAVGVWVGNAQGGGCPGITGARTAGPVMFDIFNMLPCSDVWFEEPAEGRASPEVQRLGVAWSGLDGVFMMDSKPMRIIYPSVHTVFFLFRSITSRIHTGASKRS